MAIVIADPAIKIDDVPYERITYSDSEREFTIELDLADGARKPFRFRGVVAVRLTPDILVDRRKIYVDGEYRSTIMRNTDSVWSAHLIAEALRQREPVSQSVEHYIIPVHGGMWEILCETMNKG